MRLFLFVLFFSLSAFAAEVVDGSIAQTNSLKNESNKTLEQSKTLSNVREKAVDYDDSNDLVDTTAGDFKKDGLASHGTWVDSESLNEFAKTKNIPLPRQTAYMGAGISIGIGAGLYNPTDDCDCVGIWQAQFEYFYTSWISGGVDVRFLGGDLDSDVMIMYQRYRLNVRFHKAWDKLDLFVEPIFELENTSIEEFREQVQNHNSVIRDEGWHWVEYPVVDSNGVERSIEDCEKRFSLDGFSLGVGVGMGYVVTDFVGVTGNVLLEYNFSRAIQLTLTPGVALDLRRIWTWARKKLLSTWISLEIGTQRYFNRGGDEWATYGFLGFQLGV